MEKKLIIRFLKEKRRGAYNLLVEFYASQIFSLSKTMALTIIEEDLENECGSPMKLSYFSLARAMSRYKKKHPKLSMGATKPVPAFQDAHELKRRSIKSNHDQPSAKEVTNIVKDNQSDLSMVKQNTNKYSLRQESLRACFYGASNVSATLQLACQQLWEY